MIVHLDSSYRNIKTYPFPSEFEIEFNGQPPPRSDVHDLRGQYVTAEYAQYSFRWVGNETSDLFNIPNDTLSIIVIPLNPASCLLAISNPVDYYLLNDYFVGMIMRNSVTGQSAVVAMYNGDDFVFFLDQPLFSAPFSAVSYREFVRSTPSPPNYVTVPVSLTNPSFSAGNNLVILGSTSLVASTPTEFALAKGLNTTLFVENVTKKWTSKIKSIVGTYRSVILESFPSYSSGDVFIVWLERVPFSSDPIRRLHISGVQDFIVESSGGGYSVGEELRNGDDTIVFKVELVDAEGKVLQMRCLEAGSFLEPGQSVRVKPRRSEVYDVNIGIIRTGNWFRVVSDEGVPTPLRGIPDRKNPFFLVGILNPLNYQMMYFSVVAYYFPLIYLNITAEEVQVLNAMYASQDAIPFRFFIIPFFSLFPNINAPIVPYQNATCYEVTLSSLSLPNLPVCGFDVLLSDLPYVLVTLTNTGTPNNDSYGTLISNNPASLNANFVCPIANIRNPQIVKFVVVASRQRTVFKFTPRNALRFRVSLPNGDLLRYSTTFVPYDVQCDALSLPLSGCRSINQPLNKNTLDDNAVFVFPLTTSNLVSATFVMNPI